MQNFSLVKRVNFDIRNTGLGWRKNIRGFQSYSLLSDDSGILWASVASCRNLQGDKRLSILDQAKHKTLRRNEWICKQCEKQFKQCATDK